MICCWRAWLKKWWCSISAKNAQVQEGMFPLNACLVWASWWGEAKLRIVLLFSPGFQVSGFCRYNLSRDESVQTLHDLKCAWPSLPATLKTVKNDEKITAPQHWCVSTSRSASFEEKAQWRGARGLVNHMISVRLPMYYMYHRGDLTISTWRHRRKELSMVSALRKRFNWFYHGGCPL